MWMRNKNKTIGYSVYLLLKCSKNIFWHFKEMYKSFIFVCLYFLGGGAGGLHLDRDSCKPIWTHYMTKDNLELLVILPLSPRYCNYRYAPPHPALCQCFLKWADELFYHSVITSFRCLLSTYSVPRRKLESRDTCFPALKLLMEGTRNQ